MKLLLVEDDVMFRELLRKVCVSEFRCEIVGETGSGDEAITLATERKPDVILLDLALPKLDGFEVIRRVSLIYPTPRFLIISAHCEEYTAYRIERARVSGFIDKSTSMIASLRAAIIALGHGEVYFSQSFQAVRIASIMDSNSFLKTLSRQERTILSLIGSGLTDEEIAARLVVATRTIQSHRSHISHKLNLSSISKLVIFSQTHGLAIFGNDLQAGKLPT